MSAEPQPPAKVADSVLRVHEETRSEKAEVRFEPGPTVLAKAGESLLRVAEANRVRLESGCRMGLCGADPVRILAGEENLSPPTAAERATLQRLGLPPDCRMACSSRVRGPVTVAPGVEQQAVQAVAPAPPMTVAAIGTTADVRRLVVIGNGVAGVTAAVELRDRRPQTEITIVGAEPYDFYNRMVIDKLVNESTAINQLYLLPRDWTESRNIRYLRGVAARSVDRGRCAVVTEEGEAIPYDRLLLATGAECLVPPIDGFGMSGSFVLRTIDDAVQLQQYIRRERCRTAVVVGGGLLGLEAASSISQMEVRVFVLDVASWPLSRQLDQAAGALLWQMMSDLGITILPQVQARRILGADRVEGVELSDGQSLKADLCLVATGIKPNVALAEAAGLAVDLGVVVNDRMMTSDPRIFAAGDVAAHQGRVHGRWRVGVEQAQVAAANMLGGDCHYKDITPPAKLKVAGIDLLSVGEIAAAGDDVCEIRVDDGAARRYRKLVLRSGRASGAILVGHAELFDGISEAVLESRDLSLARAALEQGDWSVLEGP